MRNAVLSLVQRGSATRNWSQDALVIVLHFFKKSFWSPMSAVNCGGEMVFAIKKRSKAAPVKSTDEGTK